MADIKRAGTSGQVDTANSTTSTLTAGSVFTGSWTEVLDWTHITIQIFASHASATDGLAIQWSSDASNIDDEDNFTIPASSGKVFTFGPQSKYFRIKYTNGGTNQTAFRLQTILKLQQQKASSHRLSESVMNDDDAELTKSVLAGEVFSALGTFKNIKITSDGRLLISQEAATPADTTEIIILALSSTNGTEDTLYTITNGKTLTLQLFQAGAESNSIGGSKVGVYEDPNGNLSVLNLVSIIYVNGSSFENTLSVSFVGNGTRRILLRRAAVGGSSREIFGRIKGFEL